MKRLAVLGNSHLASLKRGWQRLSAQVESPASDWEPCFYGAPGGELNSLARAGARLVSPEPEVRAKLAFTSGGNGDIDVAAHEAVLIYGLDLRVPVLPEALSEQVRQLTCEDCVAASQNLRLARLVREIVPDMPVIIAPGPMSSEVQRWVLDRRPETYPQVIARLQRAAEAWGIGLQGQPEGTLVQGWFTEERHAREAVDLAAPGSRDLAKRRHRIDHYHMGEEYGALWWQDFLAALRGG